MECDPKLCKFPTCANQRFQQMKYPSLIPIQTDGRGWGLKLGQDVEQVLHLSALALHVHLS